MSLLLLFGALDAARVTQESLESAYASDNARLTQEALEAAYPGDRARLTQEALETAYPGSHVKATQEALEAAYPSAYLARVTQEFIEAAYASDHTHITQESLEAGYPWDHAQVTQESLEAGYPGSHVKATQESLEVAYPSDTPPRLATYIPPSCWDALTDRLLAYLGKPFNTASGDNLWQTFSAIARELTGCSRSERLEGGDARAAATSLSAGTSVVVPRFSPIERVTGVFRMDATGTVVIDSYPVLSWDDTTITVGGSIPARSGDLLVVDYSYTHKALEKRVLEALADLNIRTATGGFLDSWATFFGMTRLFGLETDSQFGARIIDRVLASRNTRPAILAAVTRLTGGSPFIVEWWEPEPGGPWVFKPLASPIWTGGDTTNHLIWGRTARFFTPSGASNPPCTFEVWVPAGSPYSDAQILAVVNSYKAAGTTAIIKEF